MSRIINPVVPELLEALAAKLTAMGRRMVVWNTDADGAGGVIAAMRQGAVDGVVFTAGSHQSEAMRAALDRGFPVVSLNRYLDGAACDQVVSTNREGGRRLARYLAAHGRRRIAFVNGPLDRTTLADREEGFRAGLAEAGQPLDPALYAQDHFAENRFREAARALVSGSARPDAIACGNDLIAIGVLNGLRSVGLSAPADIWVTGFDGIEMTGWDIVDLTTMRQPLDLMAADAAEALIRRIEGGATTPRTIEYRTELIVRGSTAHAGPIED